MLARRTFLQASALAAVASPLAVSARLAAATGHGIPHHVLVDKSLGHSGAFASAWATDAHIARGALVSDWTRLQAALGAQGRISGLSRASDLPMVMQLVAAKGARLVYRSEHDARSGAWQHGTPLPADNWSQHLGERIALRGGGVCPAPLSADLRCTNSVPLIAPSEFLIAWSVVYGEA
jgi:hypothetical protein